ncbi:MAG: type II toxin-antitoxin system VapB family antitoxin [Planctomycetes bacterium]|nr:type II toxin-antitoxin system VapB family antitoxin [Planctomycetota bacterium]
MRISIDARLCEEVRRLTGARSATAAVEQALREFVARHRQQGLLALFGKLSWQPDYDYKVARDRRQTGRARRCRRAGLPRRSPNP